MLCSAISVHGQKYVCATAYLLISGACFEIADHMITSTTARAIFAFLSVVFFARAITSFTAKITHNKL